MKYNNESYYVSEINCYIAKRFIEINYPNLKCSNSAIYCYGLFKDVEGGLLGWDSVIEGVVMYDTPWGNRVKTKVFKNTFEGKILDLHRIYVKPEVSVDNYILLLSKSVDLIEKDHKDVKCILIYDKDESNSSKYLLSGFVNHGKASAHKQRYIHLCQNEGNNSLNDVNVADIDIDTTIECLKEIWKEHKDLTLGKLLGNSELNNTEYINLIRNKYKKI